MNNIIRQILDFSALKVEYPNPTSAHLSSLVAYHAQALLQLARYGDKLRRKPFKKRTESERQVLRDLGTAANQFDATINKMIESGVKNTVTEITLAHHLVTIFDMTIDQALKDVEELLGRMKQARNAAAA